MMDPGSRIHGHGSAATSDRIIREHVASHLTTQLNRLPAIETTLLDSGGLAYMSKTAARSRNSRRSWTE